MILRETRSSSQAAVRGSAAVSRKHCTKRGNQIIIARPPEIASGGHDERESWDGLSRNGRQDARSIASAAKTVIGKYPRLHVLINNAGIMPNRRRGERRQRHCPGLNSEHQSLGDIRVLRRSSSPEEQPSATIIYNTSVLGYVPLAVTAVYSPTKRVAFVCVVAALYAQEHRNQRSRDRAALVQD